MKTDAQLDAWLLKQMGSVTPTLTVSLALNMAITEFGLSAGERVTWRGWISKRFVELEQAGKIRRRKASNLMRTTLYTLASVQHVC